jgi:mRNA-degrading endonuclease RelE of RelBE toxin-antitoxin system
VWRVRVGDYRILYHIEDERLVVVVVTSHIQCRLRRREARLSYGS